MGEIFCRCGDGPTEDFMCATCRMTERRELESHVITLRNLLREWAGQRTKRPNLRERTLATIEETKQI